MKTVVISRTTQGATVAARLAIGDTVSLVGESLNDAEHELIAAAGAGRFIISWDPQHAVSLGEDLANVAQLAAPGAQVLLVMSSQEDSGLVDSMASALEGWIVDGATVSGDTVALHAVRTVDEADVGTTLQSLQGGMRIASMLGFVADPSSHDLAEFDYESSRAISYLSQVPGLKAEIAELRQELADPRRHQRRTGAKHRSIDEASRAAEDAAATKPSHGTPRRRPSRYRKAVVAITALVATALVAGLAAEWSDTGFVGFIGTAALIAIAALAYETRRRFVALHGRVLQNAASLQRFSRLQQSLLSHVEQIEDEMATSHDVTDLLDVARSRLDELTHQTDIVRATAEDTRDRVGTVRESQKLLTTRIDQWVASTDATLGGFRAWAPSKGDVARTVRSELLVAYNQIESNLRLRDVVEVTGYTPSLRGWAASPDVIALLVSEMRRTRPSLIVECGSGASTAWLAMATRSMALDTRIVALEHDQLYAEATSRLLDDCGVADLAEVRLAPLSTTPFDRDSGPWYDLDAVDDLMGIGLVFVDGPPGQSNALSRYPALPVLRPRLAPQATVVLDDLVREEEKRTVERWKKEFPEATETVLSLEKGVSVLRFVGR